MVGLVFVAAFAPEQGERLGEVEGGSRDSVLMAALVPLRYPKEDGGDTAVEFAIDPAKFRDAFAADLPPERTAVMAWSWPRPSRGIGILGTVRPASMEVRTMLGRGRDRRPGGTDVTR